MHKSATSPAAPRPVALITGAGRRLGLHITQSLLARGWQVVVLTRHCNEALAALPQQSLTCIEFDAFEQSSVERAIEQIRQQVSRLDFILHNASVYEKDADHTEDAATFYDRLYQIHMKLPAMLNQSFADLLQTSANPHSNIIHITDIYVDNPNPDYALYCSTKAGSENLMKSFAKRLAPKVRVNAIQPGPIKFLDTHSAADKSQVMAETLLAEEGGFEALEKAIYAILDNHYMTASVVRVDGGRALA